MDASGAFLFLRITRKPLGRLLHAAEAKGTLSKVGKHQFSSASGGVLLRVALFTDTYLPEVNGAARALGRWVDYLQSNGIPCKVFAPSVPGADAEAERGQVERFAGVRFPLYPDVRLAVPNVRRAERILREFRPTIVHVATTFGMGLAGRRLAGKLNVPLIASYHTFWDQYLANYGFGALVGVQWRIMRWFHEPCVRVLVPSEAAKTHLERHGMQRLGVWSRGVDTGRFRPLPDAVRRREALRRLGADPDKFTLLYVGRLAREKSVDMLLTAYELLDESLKERTQLLLAGGGPMFSKLKRICRNPSVRFLGFRQGEELSELYGSADLFVFPSATETFGNVVLEAMASGLPVIGASAGGVGGIVRHEETGWLCAPGDAGAFRDAMARLIADDALRRRMAANALAYARTQTWDSVHAALLRCYADAISDA